MQTDILEMTADDLLRRLNSGGEGEAWNYGPNESYNEADVIELLAEKEDSVMSMLPEGYRRMSRSTDYHGEILTRRNKAGNTTFTPKLLPLVNGSVRVYVNYPKDLPWLSDERELHRLKDTDYSVNYTTGVITIPGAREDDWVYATYDHGAANKLRMLKRWALDLAVVQIARDTHLDVENYNVYQDLEKNVYMDAKRMREKGDARIAIDMLDRVATVIPLRSVGVQISW